VPIGRFVREQTAYVYCSPIVWANPGLTITGLWTPSDR
jgi:hypothetical protein